ncbi:TPA: hypothetical protein DCZ15_00870 [Candidatus Falkowbacteria bacterium]|nr:MAG: hypothetical protein UV95_C0003G0035 [Candidatus Falkowbacteria bacterium GW2011_GWF2_43_32]HBA36407.1 hypothetical protein [Candidatus Falkowbacteria bacterium]
MDTSDNKEKTAKTGTKKPETEEEKKAKEERLKLWRENEAKRKAEKKRKLMLLIMSLALAIITFFLFLGYVLGYVNMKTAKKNNDDSFQNVNTQISNLDSTLIKTQNRLIAVQQETTNLDSALVQTQNQLITAQQEITNKLESNYRAVKKQVNNVDWKLKTVQKKVTEMEKKTQDSLDNAKEREKTILLLLLSQKKTMAKQDSVITELTTKTVKLDSATTIANEALVKKHWRLR